jgi:hypothetical protein
MLDNLQRRCDRRRRVTDGKADALFTVVHCKDSHDALLFGIQKLASGNINSKLSDSKVISPPSKH